MAVLQRPPRMVSFAQPHEACISREDAEPALPSLLAADPFSDCDASSDEDGLISPVSSQDGPDGSTPAGSESAVSIPAGNSPGEDVTLRLDKPAGFDLSGFSKEGSNLESPDTPPTRNTWYLRLRDSIKLTEMRGVRKSLQRDESTRPAC